MNDTTNNGAFAPPQNSGNPFAIKKINASLKNHTVTVQDLDNWLIYRDDNGQLVGWITTTKNNHFEFKFLLIS